MSQNHEQLWQACLAHIKGAIGQQLFSTWFSEARSVSFDNGALTIQVPSDFIREQYEDRFYAPIGEAIKHIYGDGVQLFYQIGIIQDDDSSNIILPGNRHHLNAAQRNDGVNYQKVPSGLNPDYRFR